MPVVTETHKHKKRNPNALHSHDIVMVIKGKDLEENSIVGRKAEIINPHFSANKIVIRVEGLSYDMFFERRNVKKVGVEEK